MDLERFRQLFIDYAGKALAYLEKVFPEDPERAKDLFYRAFLKLIRLRNRKPELVSETQWLMFCIHGEIRNYYKHMALKNKEYKAKLKEENKLLYEWINPFDEATQTVILQEAIEFYTESSFQQSFDDKVDIFETIKRAKHYFGEKNE